MTGELEDLHSLENPSASRRWLRSSVWFLTIGAGLLQVWAERFWLSPDATYYLDIASAYLRGDWKNAINAYWSPFFSWLLALSFWLFHPSGYSESMLLHLVNFAGLLVSLVTFEFFFRAFLHLRNRAGSTPTGDSPLSDFGWWLLGYGLFLSTSLLVLTVSITTPDIWEAAWTYLVAGLLLRIRSVGSLYLFAALGFVLACAYFTKSFYFPLSFVFLITAWLCAGNPGRTAKYAALAFAVFLLIAGPWVAALSYAKGRLTFGDAGKINFALMIDELPRPGAWQGENGTGNPKHPVRQLCNKPPVYEFAAPIKGSYPPRYDFAYWMEGVHPHFHLRGFLKVLRQSAGTFFQIWALQIECAVGLLAFLFISYGQRESLRRLLQEWYLWAPPVIACAMYSVVLVEPRYVAPFILLCWIAGFSSVLGAEVDVPRRVAFAVVLAIFAVVGVRVVKSSVSNLAVALTKQENVNWQIAQSLQRMGVRRGDKVSDLAIDSHVQWARLAGVTIVSEIPFGEELTYWSASPEERDKVLQLLAGTGARVLVTADPPVASMDKDWIPLGNTGFYARWLPSAGISMKR